WASLMASMWPVDGVIAENGGLSFLRRDGAVERRFFDGGRPDLETLSQTLRAEFPELEPADDQPYRETSLAFRRLPSPEANRRVLDALPRLGAAGTVNSLWLLAWPGVWDKLSMAQKVLSQDHGQDFAAARHGILYVGDSHNDQIMFANLPHTVGVSTVVEHDLDAWPRWITKGPGGAGFVEVAERLIAARQWP
ncbi:MAG TPA: HAD family hydrolase, partial [Magnetospirillum sp.]|nr:HAD family hydrolase [Magnetospirillum sp.]